jgi:hypothetical protein
MSDNKTKLLSEVLVLFNQFGVVPGKGADGQLMARIQQEIGNDPNAPPLLIGFNPNMRMKCPLCGHPDFNECGCPADAQMAAMV